MTTAINTVDYSRNSKLGGMPATTASGDSRDYVIVFPAHGTHKRKAADLIASSK